MRKRKIGFIYGTRPEIIKLSPVIHLCRKKNIPFFSIHTGQHYSFDMDEVFFKELALPAPEYKLHIHSKAPYRQGDHTGRMLIEMEKILLKEMPYCVVVQGDTNSVLAGALTAEKISTTESYAGYHIKVAHVEAGLRSYDRTMPEETNRFIVDHLSDFLFVPTSKEKKILLKEGVPRLWIHVTGNTIVDALMRYSAEALRKSSVMTRLGLKKDKYLLLTLHRQENVDSRKTFSDILKGITTVSRHFRMPVIFPVHPRTAKMAKRFHLTFPAGVTVTDPLGFFDFIRLEADAALILTDSGGVQEEGCVLRVPCVTLRNNTERPETVAAGANIIAGTVPGRILRACRRQMRNRRAWANPLGDGRAAEHILAAITR